MPKLFSDSLNQTAIKLLPSLVPKSALW